MDTRYLQEAITFHRLAAGPEAEAFWRGYVRGIRRAIHGETHGTREEHARLVAIPADELDRSRRELGRGYRAGCARTDPAGLFTEGTAHGRAPAVDRSGCLERVCTCHDDSAWTLGAYPAGCSACGCRWAE